MSQKTYITTAIPYVNGAPHIGHAEDYLLADIFARYKTMQGAKVRFQAGTDEHGNKIEKKAQSSNIDIKQYVDQNSQKFRDSATLILFVQPTRIISSAYKRSGST